jgi:exonuclease SbcC
MIPIKLKISGFLSYQKTVELDFTNFDLACISGSNGAGKSSILDAITWVLFGQARKNEDDALINSSFDLAEVVFEFEYENGHYQIQRNKKRGKTSTLELRMLDHEEKWTVMTEHSLRETEKKIEQILHMDYETFINTCFFLQGKADQFAQQTAGKRKEILSNILNLSIWESYRELVSAQNREISNEVISIDAWLLEIDKELEKEKELLIELDRSKLNLKQKSEILREKELSIENARRQINLAKEYENLLKTQTANLDDLRKQKLDNLTILQSRQDEFKYYEQILSDEKVIIENNNKLKHLRLDLEEFNKLEKQFHLLSQQRLEQESLIATEQARIEQEIINLKQKKQRLDNLLIGFEENKNCIDYDKAELNSLMERIKEKPIREKQLLEFQKSQSDLNAENKQLRLSMEEIKNKIEKLKSASANCPLCGQKLTSEHQSSILIELENEGKNNGNKFRENEKTIIENNALIINLQEEIGFLEGDEEKKQFLLRDLVSLEKDNQIIAKEKDDWEINGGAQLDGLEEKINKKYFALDARGRLTEIEVSIRLQGYNAEKHEQIIQNEISAKQYEERFNLLEKAKATTQPLKREIEELSKKNIDLEEKTKKQIDIVLQSNQKYDLASSNLPDLSIMETELASIRNEENELRTETARAEQNINVIQSKKEKKTELINQREEKAKAISKLESLERAFGKNGLPALLIEQALPDIENKANQILDQLSSGKMSLSFATQRERKSKKDEGAIQTLDILISDNEGTRAYEMFSGGEAFRINFAIRLALSYALARRAGSKLQTLVIDEGFGSQDSEGRQHLIEAINLVMGNNRNGSELVSDIRKILVITHLEDLKDAFPSRIEVEKTNEGSVLNLINQ